MAEEIVNKVAKSGLITIDLEELYPKGERVVYDLSQNLWKGIALKEKDFREFIKTNDWAAYQNKHVAIMCSVDAILPVWAYLLITIALEPFAKTICFGTLNELEKTICKEFVEDSFSKIEYQDTRVIIKGCSNIPNQEYALVEFTKYFTPIVKSLMFGEACSTVPLYKKAK
jgi:hypothetical protein